MNIDDLRAELKQLNIPISAYSLVGGLPNESYCIGKKGNKYEVYYSERGSKSNLKIFDNEHSACEHFHSIIKKQKF